MYGLQSEVDATDNVDSVLPEYLTRTAHKIDSIKRVGIQGVIQRYIDHSISSTINLPEDVSPEMISDIYIKSWQNNLKGVTIYRDGSRLPILSTEETKITKYQELKTKTYNIMQETGETIEILGDDIFKLPDGRLTTMYHYLEDIGAPDTKETKINKTEIAEEMDA